MAEVKKTTIETVMDKARAKYDAAIKAANDALDKSPVDLVAYNQAMIDIKDAEDDYMEHAALAVYDEVAKMSNPVIEIVKRYDYEILGHKEVKSDNGRVTSVDPLEKRRQIDLLKFCTRANLSTDWQHRASKCNQLMCLRAATDLGCDVSKIAKSYYLQKAANELDMGKTPTSKTKVCKLLQSVIDAILPSTDGETTYKVNSHDVAYLDDLYGRKGKKRLAIRVSNDAFFRRILVDICYRLVTNSKYDVEGFKEVKQDKKKEGK